MQPVRRNILIAVFVFAVVAVAAISWYATRPKGTSANLYGPAMAKLAASESAAMKIDVQTFFRPGNLLGGDRQDGALATLDLPLQIKGPLVLSYPRGGALTGNADVSLGVGYVFDSVMNLAAVVDADGQLYAKISDLPEDSGLPLNAHNLNGAWFTISGNDLSRLSSVFGEANQAVSSSAVRISADTFRSAAQGWLLPFGRYEDMQVNGQAAEHYELLTDKEGLSIFLAEAVGALRGRICTAEERGRISAYVEGRRILTEAWVGKQSGNLLRLSMGLFPEGGAGGMPVAVTIDFEGLDVPVGSDVPAEASPLSAVLMRALRTTAASPQK